MSNSNLNLKSFFTMDANIQRLKRLPELKTPILDLVYPENRRINYPKSIICAEDLPKEIKNIPVIKRGTQAVAVGVQAAPTENTRVNAKVAMTPGSRTETMYSLGASYRFNWR